MKTSIMHSVFTTTGLLLLPFLLMQVSNQVNWDHTDFIVMGILIWSTCFALFETMRRVRITKQKILVGAGIVVIFLYVWAELAVGIFTNLGS